MKTSRSLNQLITTQQNFNLNNTESFENSNSLQSLVSTLKKQQFDRNHDINEFLNKTITNSLYGSFSLINYTAQPVDLQLKQESEVLEKESELQQEMIDSVEKIKTRSLMKIQKLTNSVSKKCRAVVRKYHSGRVKIYKKNKVKL